MGHAKSEITNHFFATKGIVPFVKTMGAGTTIDSLLGGIDIGLFTNGLIDEEATKERRKTDPLADPVYLKKPGTMEYLVENSFMNHEFVVLEEAFDAPDFVLETFKDILTSKCLRNGSQVFNIKTKMIVVCTNRERAHIAEDNSSIKALMERFPMEIKVVWPTYNKENYNYMFKESFGLENNLVSFICEELSKNQIIVSPRTAVKVLRGVEESGIDFLSFVADFNSEKAKDITKNAIKKYKASYELEEIIKTVDTAVKSIENKQVNSVAEVPELAKVVQIIQTQMQRMDKMKKEDETVKKCQELKEEWNKIILSTTDKIKELMPALDGLMK